MAKLVRLPQNVTCERPKAVCFESCRVDDDPFWVPRSLITSQWETPEGEIVEEDDPRAIYFVQYAPAWFFSKNQLWGKLQGSHGF